MNLKKKPKFHYFSENQRSEDALTYKFFVLSAIGCLQMQLFIGRHRLQNCVSFLSFHQFLLCHSGIHRRIKHQATISKQETEGEGESSGRGRKREGRTGYPHKKGALKQLLTLSSIPTNRSIIIYISIICLYNVVSEHFQSIIQMILLSPINFLPSTNCRKETGYNH